MEKEVSKMDLEFADKLKELGSHANALISLHLKQPESFDKEWLFNKLLNQYEELGLDIDNQEED